MTNNRRIQWPGAVYLVSNRCIEGQAFFRPSEALNEIIERNLAWCAETHDVRVMGFMFGLNGFEMIVGAPKMNLHSFMGLFQSTVAKEVSALIGRTEKGFFEGRYDSVPILDAESVCSEFVRMICAPCVAGLVGHPRDWPGVCSWDLHESGKALVKGREDRSIYWRLKQKYPEMSDAEATRRATSTYRLNLARLPTPTGHGQIAMPCKLVERHLDSPSSVVEHFLGAERVGRWPIRRQAPRLRPPRTRLCVTTSPTRREAFEAYVEESNFFYDLARAGLRKGRPKPRFPYGMIPLHKNRTVGPRGEPLPRSMGARLPDQFSPRSARRPRAA